jgi:hypothetical protein
VQPLRACDNGCHVGLTRLTDRKMMDAINRSVDKRTLDHYLYIAGEYRAFQKQKANKRRPTINTELQMLFTNSVAEDDLKALLGETH